MSRLLCALWLLVVTGAPQLAARAWPDLDPEEFSRTQPVVDPEAGAEIILRETRIDGLSYTETTYEHFVRIRVFNQRGIDKLSKIDLSYDRGQWISGVEARTIKADGTIIPLSKKDIYDREVAKVGSYRQRVRSFAPAALEAGDIIDYRYRVEVSRFTYFYALAFQGDLPARTVRYQMRPLGVPRLIWRTLGFNCPIEDVKRDRNGYVTFEQHNLAAWEDEPFQLPKIHQQPTVLFYLREDKLPTPQEYWEDLAAEWYREGQKRAKVTKAITEAAQALYLSGDDDDTKLRKIHAFCRTQIENRALAEPAPGKKFLTNVSASDTLKRRSGWPSDIDELFIALARAAGFDAQPARLSDRNFILFNPEGVDPFYITDEAVAVRRGENQWQYTQPGTDPLLPFGMVAWRNTNTQGLIAQPKGGAPRLIPGSRADRNQSRRVGRFELGSDGTLEGQVTLTYTGYAAAARRHNGREQTEQERIDSLRDELRDQMPTAEVTEAVYSNWDDIDQPLTITFQLKVPEYADRTGSRLFVQPSVFEKNTKPLFRNAERRTEMLFHHQYLDEDDIQITHPEGYQLEAGSAPGLVDMLGAGEYHNAIRYSRTKRQISYERRQRLDAIIIAKAHYARVKQVFEQINAADQHALTLRRVEEPKPEATAETTPATPPLALAQP